MLDLDAKIDFEGQRLSERYLHLILTFSGIVSFLVGFALQSLQTTLYILLAGGIIASLVSIPPWPMYRSHPVKYLPKIEIPTDTDVEVKEGQKETGVWPVVKRLLF
ncbi:uncharacterized protein SPPG_02487 [Spizellomyces punctatus DAOM BR117]|uniref:Signal peptidase complex subunit 1 n=1 Tax=Spizellomyces punctatus (strain DAOM BR117) TaxID=645134 RepID=A0A0L0HM37_SPIPD|nr:uncharacterized protein SPPG_02487 [Spizellomyces punctatus DAOM BR117]KND01980.1 hypothetical protein SPPG_02487 [Spizellomyces punctatus DAOM BR117]|eukprot:XP_016610019.1 hypothetical protein SPPG_02487 [Spizellomyces punctatus DAOM BR117]